MSKHSFWKVISHIFMGKTSIRKMKNCYDKVFADENDSDDDGNDDDDDDDDVVSVMT